MWDTEQLSDREPLGAIHLWTGVEVAAGEERLGASQLASERSACKRAYKGSSSLLLVTLSQFTSLSLFPLFLLHQILFFFFRLK